MATRYLVFGASGYIGGNLVPFLIDRGATVRAVARDREVLEARHWAGVELVEADALEPGSLIPALAESDIVFYLVHSMAAGKDFGALDLVAAENFARAAADAGVQRIIYLGGLIPDSSSLGEHISSRRDTGEVLREGPVPVTEIRAGIIIGPGSAAFEVMRDLALNLPVMITPRWVRATSPPIALSNLLEYLWKIAHSDEAAGQVYDAAGPEEVDYTSMMRAIARQAGKSPPLIIPVPVLTPTLSSYWLGLVTAVPAPIARALITGLKHSFSADDGPLRKAAPQHLLTMDDAVAMALRQERQHQTLARWTDGNFQLRGHRHDNAYYSKHAGSSTITRAKPAALWGLITGLGGPQRYHYMNGLWLIREIMDWIAGGPGLSRGRRSFAELRLGDRIDYWTVLALQEERSLTLEFGLKAPGSGALEFQIKPLDHGLTELRITAHWHPRGVWGLLYWWAMFPAHLFLFRGWTKKLARLAETDS
ncbi:DUF2867 domain-containing protein [Congregibacter litoralis]|uniref:Putative nucleoside-diphosphate-sugar epimerase n=1 Tax=Congregibacter litoralis KT71 TaxID=314285 RepID=A4A947_9GAMM|nr:DUF2867 domain-containing protein [Congregibacter litoralis]EAQ97589.1 putative nucleoside-diphosphate-sugar epimerase [Congregibacter litoralis KT71]